MSVGDYSKKDANSILLLGHVGSGMGERSLTFKFHRALEKRGYEIAALFDIIELMGEKYTPFAELNYDLADQGYPLLDDLDSLKLPHSDILLILSWSFSVAALFATGIQKTRPTIVKLFAHHVQERLLPLLYEPAELLLTESLLANERALAYGIDPGKTLFIPHCYPQEWSGSGRDYALKLASEQGKKVSPSTLIIGCVSRFEYGKNCEYAIEAVRRLYERGKEVILILKGKFPEVTTSPEYRPLFSQMLAAYQNEPWLIWDQKVTPYPEVIAEYESFDLLLHPSGAEGGSHVVVECLGLNKPVVLLNGSTNPYLFKGVAHFVKTTGKLQSAPLPFYLPDLDDLCRVLDSQLKPPDPLTIESRFHERVLQERLPLLFSRDKSVIQELYAIDRLRFGL